MASTGQTPTNPTTDPADHVSLVYENKRAELRHLVPLAEAADFLGVSRWTVRRMIAAGGLTGYRVGSHLRVHKQDLSSRVRKVKPSEVMAPEDRRKDEFLRGMEAASQDRTT